MKNYINKNYKWLYIIIKFRIYVYKMFFLVVNNIDINREKLLVFWSNLLNKIIKR